MVFDTMKENVPLNQFEKKSSRKILVRSLIRTYKKLGTYDKCLFYSAILKKELYNMTVER